MTTLSIPGLSEGENDTLNTLVNQLASKTTRNLLRKRYYDSKQVVRQLGIAIPPQFTDLETVIGWPAKSVKILERRINFDGLVVPNGSNAGLDGVFAENQISIEASQAHTAALKYGVAFMCVTRGDVSSGEPEVLITPRSALNTTGLWDARRRRLSAVLSVVSATNTGQMHKFILYLPDRVVTASRPQWGTQWSAVSRRHGLGRVPVAMLRYDPDTDDRPLGRSKISRTVMSLTDQAVRTLLRTEVAAEFYSAPQRYILGVEADAFVDGSGNTKTGWETVMGHLLAMPRDKDTDQVPEVGQFPQMSMEPHSAHLRSIAASFAGEANIPVNSLGIIHDNPSSDAAMHTAYLDLIQDAERCHTTFGSGWADVGRLAVMTRDGLSAVPGELVGLASKFRDAATPTKQAATQSVVEQVREGILPADSEVTLEALGYDEVTIQRIIADRRRSQAGDRLTQLVEAARTARGQ